MDRLIWGNTIESYLWTIGVILFVLLAQPRYLKIFCPAGF
jgi:hypothetical protein